MPIGDGKSGKDFGDPTASSGRGTFDDPHQEGLGLWGSFRQPPPEKTAVEKLAQQPIHMKAIVDAVNRGGFLRNVRIERLPSDEASYSYILNVRPSWQSHGGYCTLFATSPVHPRVFRDLDRLHMMIRVDFRYSGIIELHMRPVLRSTDKAI